MFTHFQKGIRYALFFICIQFTWLNAQPIPTRPDIQIKELATVSNNSIRIKKDPLSGNLYILERDGDIKRIEFGTDSIVSFTTAYQASDHGLNNVLGMTFGPDGTIYLVGNETNQSNNQLGTGIIVKGISVSQGSEERTWTVLAQTVEYLYGNTYNHRMSGVVVDPNGEYIYVNSGARTDHGEIRQGYREVGLTAIILKLPANGENITLQDDREWLRTNGYLMAEGIRNDFDLAYAGNGDLFSVENSGDRDDPEEMNWIQEGHHYGFPWIIGGNNTPQQYSPYQPMEDPLLSPSAWGGGQLYVTFSDDPAYPQPPDGVTFSDAVFNTGPDADRFRDTATGDVKDASDLGITITTFTTHRSPNGIVFDKDSVLAGDLSGGAFVISLNSSQLAQPLGDTGEDVLHVALTKNDEVYTAQITRLVYNLNTPLGIELVGNKLFVLETGLWGGNNDPKLWEITLPTGTVDVSENENLPEAFELHQNYPNPFNPSTTLSFVISHSSLVILKIFDVLGREVATIVNEELPAGTYKYQWNASGFASGVYFYQLQAGNFTNKKKLILLR